MGCVLMEAYYVPSEWKSTTLAQEAIERRAGTNEVTDITLAAWLDRQLARREWSRADFARHLGVGTGTVSKWFGGRQPSPEYSDRIADVLGADPDVVLALAGHRHLDEEVDPDSSEGRITAKVRRIAWTEERVRFVENLLDSMLDTDRRQGGTR